MLDHTHQSAITRSLVTTPERVAVTAELFGPHFPTQFEPFVYTVAREIAEQYGGGYWLFYRLGNGGFYMAPDSDLRYRVRCSTRCGWTPSPPRS